MIEIIAAIAVSTVCILAYYAKLSSQMDDLKIDLDVLRRKVDESEEANSRILNLMAGHTQATYEAVTDLRTLQENA